MNNTVAVLVSQRLGKPFPNIHLSSGHNQSKDSKKNNFKEFVKDNNNNLSLTSQFQNSEFQLSLSECGVEKRDREGPIGVFVKQARPSKTTSVLSPQS